MYNYLPGTVPQTTDYTGSNQSLGANGYQKFPGGAIMQWGSVTKGTVSNTNWELITVTFPIAFPSFVQVSASMEDLSATTGAGRDNIINMIIQGITGTGFTAVVKRPTTAPGTETVNLRWTAMGS